MKDQADSMNDQADSANSTTEHRELIIVLQWNGITD